MSKSNDILNSFKEQISSFTRLSFEDAKALYVEAMQELDESIKKEKINNLIEGTLYVVLNFIKRNNLCCLENAKYDTNDIINTCSEIWIKAIKDGKLLEVNSYANIMDLCFCSNLEKSLTETDFTVSDLTILTASSFNDFLYEFIEFDNSHGQVSYEDFLKLFDKVFGTDEYGFRSYFSYRMNQLKLSDSDVLQQTYEILVNIVDAIKDEEDVVDNFTRTKIEKFKDLLIELGLQGFEVNMERVYQNDFSNSLVNSVDYSKFIEAVFSCAKLDDRKKDLIAKLYGVNGSDKLSMEEASCVYGVTRARVGQLHLQALNYLKEDSNVVKYKNLLR